MQWAGTRLAVCVCQSVTERDKLELIGSTLVKASSAMDTSAERQNASATMPDDELLPLSEDEQRILALYDRLQELQLEISLLKAQQVFEPCLSASRPLGLLLI